MLSALTLKAQSTSVVTIGTITANQASNGLGFNLDPNQDWEWAAAAAAGATHARIQCSWSIVEQQTAPPLNAPASVQYIEDPNCALGLQSAQKYDIQPTVVAAYGPPFHTILTVTIPGGAKKGATSIDIQYQSGVGGDTLANIAFPHDYICPAFLSSSGQMVTKCSSQFTGRHSYQGTLVTGVKLTDSTHATISLASALTNALPADTTPYIVQEILYPSTANENAADASVKAYGDYVSFLANDVAAHGLKGDIEIWNEPPWANDPWDQRAGLYDSGMYTGTSEFGANFGFAANLMNRTFPSGVTATWNGTSGTSNGSLLNGNMQKYSGVALTEPSTTITSESFHPYTSAYGNPEDDMFEMSCLQGEVNSSHALNCMLPGTEGQSNLFQSILSSLQQQAINPTYGIGHSITETNQFPPVAGLQMQQARAVLRQFIGFQADGITPIEFYKLYLPGNPDPSYSFVQEVGSTGTYTPTPAYSALSGFMADLKPISNAPVTVYPSSTLPSIASYRGTYALGAVHMVGARQNATANSDAFILWQISACKSNSCWYSLASPSAAPVTVDIPAGLKVTGVTNLTTRASVSYTSSGQQITFNVSDDPIEILVDPTSYGGLAAASSSALQPTALSLSTNPTSSTYGNQVVLTALVHPFATQSTNGGTVTFYAGSNTLGSATLSSGVATLNVTSIPAGANNLYARYTGSSSFAASFGSATISVAPAIPTLALPAISNQVEGEPVFTVLATSNSPAPITYKVVSGPFFITSYTSAGVQVKPVGAGAVVFQASQVASGNYAAATAQVTFTVNGEDPSLSLPTIPTKLYKAAGPFTVQAISRSAAPITYSVVSGPATVAGSTVTLTGVGNVVLEASQPAEGNYGAATAHTSFAVQGQTTTSLSLPAISNQVFGEPVFTIPVTTNSPGSITYKVLSGPLWIASSSSTGVQVKPIGIGAIVFQVSQAASGSYAAATAQVSFTVAAEDPSLSISTITTKLYKATGPFTVKASSHSPATITYSVVSGPATVSGSTVTLTGAGTVVLEASQPANGTYAAAAAQTSFAVQSQTTTSLILPTITNQVFGEPVFTIPVTTNSPGSITYKVSGPLWIASSSSTGVQVKPIGIGPVVFQVSQAASGSYAAATAQVSFTVAAEDPSLTLPAISSKLYKASGPFAVKAVSRSPAAITYSVVSGPATVSGSTVTLTGAGTVVLEAQQAASGTYAAAAVQTSFAVQAQTPTTLTLPNIGSQVSMEPVFTIPVASNSPGPITYKVVTGSLWIASSSSTAVRVRPMGAGTVVLQVTQAASGNYAPATAQITFPVN